MKSDLVDLMLVQHHETPGAVLVSELGHEAQAVWLPKSKIEIEETGKTVVGSLKNGQMAQLPTIKVALPEWIAIQKRLV